MKKVLYFDMDGTIANLYESKDWLEKIVNQEPVFTDLEEMPDWASCRRILKVLKMKFNYQIGVVTWTPMNTTTEYEAKSRAEKNMWLADHAPDIFDFVTFQTYGTPKELAIRSKHIEGVHILFDDNHEVRESWEQNFQQAFDEKNMLSVLKTLLAIELS